MRALACALGLQRKIKDKGSQILDILNIFADSNQGRRMCQPARPVVHKLNGCSNQCNTNRLNILFHICAWDQYVNLVIGISKMMESICAPSHRNLRNTWNQNVHLVIWDLQTSWNQYVNLVIGISQVHGINMCT